MRNITAGEEHLAQRGFVSPSQIEFPVLFLSGHSHLLRNLAGGYARGLKTASCTFQPQSRHIEIGLGIK